MYRQKVGTEDVFLGLSGVDPSSNHCQEILYKIELPGATMKDIQIDLNDKQMVIQSKDYYLTQYFQYTMNSKKAKAKFISDKDILELILPIQRSDDLWLILPSNCYWMKLSANKSIVMQKLLYI